MLLASVGDSDLWFALAALVLAGIDQLRARGQALTTWAAIALAVALLLAWWPDG